MKLNPLPPELVPQSDDSGDAKCTSLDLAMHELPHRYNMDLRFETPLKVAIGDPQLREPQSDLELLVEALARPTNATNAIVMSLVLSAFRPAEVRRYDT